MKHFIAFSDIQTSRESVLSAEEWNRTYHFGGSVIRNESGSGLSYIWGNKLLDCDGIIPGLKQTNINGVICTRMVPQGICIVGPYILISAYCSEKKHHSVIYVVKNSTKEFVCTIRLDTKSHVGGIAYDPVYKNLWVCDSSNSSNYRLLAYRMSTFQWDVTQASWNKNQSFSMTHFAQIPVDVVPSFCTWYDGMIWVGEFKKSGEGTVAGYSAYHVTLTRGARFSIPAYSQGISFIRYHGLVYCAVTMSHGRKNDSMVSSYTIPDYYRRKEKNTTLSTTHIKSITMPGMIEGIQIYDNLTYAIFESAAYQYYFSRKNGRSKAPCDRICVFSTNFILC